MANEDLIISVKVENGKESVKLLQSVGQVVKQIDKDSDKLSAKLNKAMSALSQEIRVLSAATDLNAKYAISQQKVAQEIEKTAAIRESYVNKQIKNAKLQDSLIQQQAIGQQKLQQEMAKTNKSLWQEETALIKAETASSKLSLQMAKTESGINKLNETTKNSVNIFQKFNLSLKVALGNLISDAIRNFSSNMLDLAKSLSKAGIELDALNNTMMAATGGWEQGGREINWLIGMSDRLGLAFGDVSDSYAKFMTSFTRSGGTVSQSRQIFEDLSTAMVSLHLPAERMQGVFVALEQMANKGTVQAEELKRQLGNALPGAFELAAESMGVLPKQLMDMMKKGEVFSKDFLPAFAATVKKALGQSIEIASVQFNASMGRLMTAFDLLKMQVGQALNEALLPFVNALIPLVRGLANTVKFFNENTVASSLLKGALAGLAATILTLNLPTLIASIASVGKAITTVVLPAVKTLIGELAVINAEMGGLPIIIGAVVTAFVALGAAISDSAKEARDVTPYIGLSQQVVNLAKDVTTLDTNVKENKETLEEYKKQFPELTQYLLDTGKGFAQLTDAEIKHIAVLGEHDAMTRAMNERTKEMAKWQSDLAATCQVAWDNIKLRSKALADTVIQNFKALGKAIVAVIKMVSNQIQAWAKFGFNIGKPLQEIGKALGPLGTNLVITGKAIDGLATSATKFSNNINKGLDNLDKVGKTTVDTMLKTIPGIKDLGLSSQAIMDKVASTANDNYLNKVKVIKQNTQSIIKDLKQAQTSVIGLDKPEEKKKKGRTAKAKSPKEAKTEWDKLNNTITEQRKQLELLDLQGQGNSETYSKLAEKYKENIQLKQAIEKHTASLIEKQKTESDMWSKIKKSAEDTSKTYEYMTYNSQNYTQSEIDKARELAKGYNAVVKYSESLKNNNDLMKITSRTARDLTNTLVDGLFEPLKEGESIWTKFKNAGISAIKAIATEWVKNKINLVLTGAQAGWGVGTIGGGSFTDKAKMASIGAMAGINNLPLFGTRDNNPFAQATGGLSQVYDNFLEKIGANNVTDTVFTELTGQANGLTKTLVSATTPAVNGLASTLSNTGGAAIGMSALAQTASIASTAFTTAAPALTAMGTALATVASQAATAATSMAALAVATAAESVAKIPFVGGFLAPVAAAATGAAIGLGATMTGMGIGLGSSIAGGGQMLGGALGGIGNKLSGSSKIIPHAKGGIVSSPTMFPMQGGNVGVAGEAGTEVIAPARRMANGDLGIGAVQPQVTVNNYTNAAVEVIKRPNNEMEIKITELNAMLSSSRSNKGMMAAQNRMDTRGRRIG